MAIQTRLQPRYLLQHIAFAVICLVLGLWGIYDYAIKIPRDTAAFERGEVYRAVTAAAEALRDPEAAPEDVRATSERAATLLTSRIEAVQAALGAAGAGDDAAADPAGAPSVADIPDLSLMRPTDDEQWRTELFLMTAMLVQLERRRTGPLPDDLTKQVDFVRRRVDATADISRPSTFDRLVQWGFILCLPFVPWEVWRLGTKLGKRYRLEEDGALEHPGGRLAADEITDIDMSRWMAKSIATVVGTDDRRVTLDDYIFRDSDRIVGRLATRFHPEEWTEEAKPVKKDDAAEDGASRDDPPGDDTGAADDAPPDTDPDEGRDGDDATTRSQA